MIIFYQAIGVSFYFTRSIFPGLDQLDSYALLAKTYDRMS